MHGNVPLTVVSLQRYRCVTWLMAGFAGFGLACTPIQPIRKGSAGSVEETPPGDAEAGQGASSDRPPRAGAGSGGSPDAKKSPSETAGTSAAGDAGRAGRS